MAYLSFAKFKNTASKKIFKNIYKQLNKKCNLKTVLITQRIYQFKEETDLVQIAEMPTYF